MINVHGGSGEREGRDGACTPKWMADLIGGVDLDPCGNERSHIDATVVMRWDRYQDGLNFYGADEEWRVFINPPYARGQVIKWVRHYKHTRFIFLLRWDPSTEWFEEIIKATDCVWFPQRKRIEFEPPPGVTFSRNPFPHALYLRDPEPELMSRLRKEGYLLDARGVREYPVRHGQRQPDTRQSTTNPPNEGATPRGGGTAGGDGPRTVCPECAAVFQRCPSHEKEWLTASNAAGGEVPSATPGR